MTLCKYIALVKTKQNEHIDHEECFTQEEVEFRDSASARVATPDYTNKKVRIMTDSINILLIFNCVAIQLRKSRIAMNLKWTCLIIAF